MGWAVRTAANGPSRTAHGHEGNCCRHCEVFAPERCPRLIAVSVEPRGSAPGFRLVPEFPPRNSDDLDKKPGLKAT